MQELTLDTGTHWIEPLTHDVVVYDTRLKQYEIENIPAATQDGQPIHVDVSFEIGLSDAGVPNLHETIGKDYFDQVVFPAARAQIRTETANKLSDEVYTGKGRADIQARLTDSLQEKLGSAGIRIVANLRDISFQNADFVNKLEDKAKAAQDEEIERRQALAAEQKALRTEADARGEKLRVIQESEAEREKLKLEGEGERLKQEEIAQGILAIGQAEADVIKLKANALTGSGGELYRDIEVLGGLGKSVDYYGTPTGAPGTSTYIIDEALRGQIAVGGE